MTFPDSFRTERLRAERLQPSHLGDLRRLHRDAAVMARIGGLRNDGQTAEYLAYNLRHWSQHGFGLWVLHEIDGGPVIGLAMLRYLALDGVDEVEVGYAIVPTLWGRGLATEVATACVSYARDDLRLPSVIALTEPGHERSQHVLAKVGMRFERDVLIEGSPRSLFRRILAN
ncbi:MAG TPA: GNAT family N-acetyltransferase [Gemmatimonadaceae bacterium]|nr:GNAT family N-acetyltransferase [Gemmatimonadaceae bacterium]